MRNPAFGICENKGIDQLHSDSVIPLLPKPEISSLQPSTVIVQLSFLSDLVRNPEDRFSHDEAHLTKGACPSISAGTDNFLRVVCCSF